MIWVETPLLAAFDWLAQHNEQARVDNRRMPIGGVILRYSWGELALGPTPEEVTLSALERSLESCARRGLRALVLLTTKVWVYDSNPRVYAPVIPAYLDAGPVMLPEIGDVHVDPWRYVVRADTQHGPCNKYAARVWEPEIEAALRRTYLALAGGLGRCPDVLAGVVTTESSPILGAGAQLDSTGYPGAQRYAEHRIRMVRYLREIFPLEVEILENKNWLPKDADAVHRWHANELSFAKGNAFLQDLSSGPKYVRYCHPYMSLYPAEYRWGQVTNDTTLTIEEMLDLAEQLGLGHLAFLQFDKREIEAALARPGASYFGG